MFRMNLGDFVRYQLRDDEHAKTAIVVVAMAGAALSLCLLVLANILRY